MKEYRNNTAENHQEYDEIVLPDIGRVLLMSDCEECSEICANAGGDDINKIKKALDDICICAVTPNEAFYRNKNSIDKTMFTEFDVDGIVLITHNFCKNHMNRAEAMKKEIGHIPVIEVAEPCDPEKAAEELVKSRIFE